MAGHSKWANIKHKKAKEDAKKAKIFSKLSRKITVAAREGGGDPEVNSELRMLMDKAKDNNMPNDNVERAIKKGTGELEGVEYEEFTYEGYGPGGAALYIDLMTDNRNRTAAEIRHLLTKHGGNLGENGCVAWMFERKGNIVIDGSETPFDEDELMMTALEAGAEDVEINDDMAIIYTDPTDFMEVHDNLKEDTSYKIADSDRAMIPKNDVKIDDLSTAKGVIKLMDALEDHDDVQDIYSNFDIPEEIMDQIDE